MKLEELIENASKNCLDPKVVESFCRDYQLSFSELSEKFAKHIVQEYLADRFSWEYCDEAINVLWGYSIVELKDPLCDFPVASI